MGFFPSMLLLMLMINQVHHACSQQATNWFVLTPQDSKILEKDSTVLYCQLDTRRIVENMQFKVTWSKNNEEIRFSDPVFPHYSMLGDPHSVQYHLLISDADVQDTAAYACTVYENVETEPGTTEWVMRAVATASLEVLIRPPTPECKKHDLTNGLNDTEFNYEGDLVELSCLGYLADPSFTLTMKWKDEEINEHNGGWVHINDELIQERVYRFNTSHQDNGAHLQCILTSPEFPEYHESCDTVALNIIHEPKIEFVLDKTEVFENEPLTISCFAVSNPALTTYHWRLLPLQVVQFLNGGRVLKIPSVTSDTGHLNITCEVWNDHGTASESRQVQVLSRSDATTTTSAPLTEVVTEAPLQITPTGEPTTQVPTTNATSGGMKPAVTKPTKTPPAEIPHKTTQKTQTYLHGHGAISTPMLAVIIIVPVIIIVILVLIFVFLYKTIKLSTKRTNDQIRVLYQDGATVINTQRTQRGRNLNLLVQPAVNEGATIPTEGMEAGAYSLPPPYTTTSGLPSVMDNMYEDMASGVGNKTWGEKKDKMFIDMP